jgi:rfaE bifunctional protein nucleotidyltransferase chain/domain
MKNKILSAEQAAIIATQMRATGRKLVFTNGCFDLLHVGHVRYLRTARALGDALLVAINGDESVHALKGEGRPLNREADRAEVIAALECVDHVVVFGEAAELIQKAISAAGGARSADLRHAKDVKEAVTIAAEVASTGDIVLFSPGGTSFDEFNDFAARGDAFRKWVLELS